jgi:hypothetical protein
MKKERRTMKKKSLVTTRMRKRTTIMRITLKRDPKMIPMTLAEGVKTLVAVVAVRFLCGPR